MEKVSIVIPAYNAQKYVRQAIDSALAQTYRACEVIVVDDGSTDSTPELLATYVSRIRVVRQANQGTAVACATGVQAADSKWVTFLDADDEWLPEKLTRQMQGCAQFAISHTDSVCFGEALNGEVRRSSFEPLYGGKVLEQLLICNFITKSSVLMHRDVFLRHGGFSNKFGAVEDWPLWLKVCAEHDLGYLPEPVVRYRVHPHSKSMKSRATAAAHVGIINEAFSAGGVGERFRSLRRRALASSYQINCHYAAESGDWVFAIRCALKALQYEPGAIRTWKDLVKSALIPLGVAY
jgi:teichuronic acid biosynthesis glycosyltransferase TuaG